MLLARSLLMQQIMLGRGDSQFDFYAPYYILLEGWYIRSKFEFYDVIFVPLIWTSLRINNNHCINQTALKYWTTLTKWYQHGMRFMI